MLSILGEKRMASWYIYSSRGPVSVTCSSARAPANLISLNQNSATCQCGSAPEQWLSPHCSFITQGWKLSCTHLTVHMWLSHVSRLSLIYMGRRSSWRMDWARVRQEGMAGRSALSQQCCLWGTGRVEEMWGLSPGHLKSLDQRGGLWRSLWQKHYLWPVRITDKRHEKQKNGGKWLKQELWY